MQDQIQDSTKEKKNEIRKAGFNINLLFLSMLTTVRGFEVRHKKNKHPISIKQLVILF